MNIKLLFILTFLTPALFAQTKTVKIFPFKSAIIEYKYEASVKGTHIKYIDDWGYKQADYIYKQLNFGGNEDKEFEIIILIGEKAYTINLQQKEVAVGRNLTYNYYLLNQNRKCTAISEALVKAEGFKLSGTENYLSKECKVWKGDGSKKLTWKGVPLKTETNFMTMIVEKATSIKTDVDIPDGKFDIPGDVKYISSDTYQGYSGLDLDFSNSVKTESSSNSSIKVEFNSADLESCNNFGYFKETGEKIIAEGDNDYNKIDNRLIKSQQQFMLNTTVELPRYSTAVFETNNGDFGKIQISKIDKNGFEMRYMVFNSDGSVKIYSDGTTSLLENDFEIITGKNSSKIKITPKAEAKCFVLGW